MNSLVIFTDIAHVQITVAALVFFLLSGFYLSVNSSGSHFSNSAKYLIGGLLVDFLCAGYASYIEVLTSSVSVNVLVAFDLMLKLTVLLLVGLAATGIMAGNISQGLYSTLVVVLGLFVIVYFSIIDPNGAMINVLHSLLPAITFAFLTAAYFSQCFRRHNIGYVVGCLTSVFVTYIVAVNISSMNMTPHSVWYTAVVGYVGLGVSFLLSMVDVKDDALDKASKELNKYNQRIKEIIKLSPFPIVISRLSDDAILMANDNFLKLFGIKDRDINLYRFRDFFVDADNRRLLNTHLEKERVIKDFEILVKSQTGNTPFWLSTSANIIDFDYDIAIYAAFQDITDRKKREDLLQTQATRDPLTSLYNRRYFEEEVNRRLSLHTDDVFSVFMIDADHFKNVNDTYGHKIGDKVLMALASTAEKALRENDIVARYGGEEFVVYLSQTNAEDAKVVADRLREAIAAIVVMSDAGEPIKFTVSIGISSSKDSQDINELIKMSDDALYEAKEGGRNRCVIYHRDLPSEPQEVKAEKAAENVHPAFAQSNNVEVSILGGTPTEGGDKA